MLARQKRAPRLDLNPSSADRWTTCSASPQFILDNWDKVEFVDNVFNQEGTSAHEVASAYLQDRKPDETACPVPIDAAMRWHGWNYAEYVQALMGENSRLIVEQKLPLFYLHNRNAMVDAAVINTDSLHVIDYKYGAGIIVHPYRNPQATIYAVCVQFNLGLQLPLDFPVFIHIYQPRSRNAEESPFHVWETTWGEISEMADAIRSTAKAILDKAEGLMFAPSEKACQWCPAKGFCGERQRVLTSDIEQLSVIDDQPKHLPPVKAISVAQLAAILKHKPDIIRWLNDAEAYALSHMKHGGEIPGFKLVQSRGGNRYWTNPKRAAELLLETTHLKRAEVIEEKVVGPAAVEKLLGKNKFSRELTNLITKPPGSPVIAPEDDKREGCTVDPTAEFSVITEDF